MENKNISIIIKYNANINKPNEINHLGNTLDCIIPAKKVFQKWEWKKAVQFYLECTSPITTTQQFGWAIPDGIEKDALNLADALLGFCIKSEAKNIKLREIQHKEFAL